MILRKTAIEFLGAVACMAVAAGVRAAESADEGPTFESRAAAFERQLAELAEVDPLHPETLETRIAYARLLHDEAKPNCAPHLDAAERQLAPILGAGRGHLIAYADGMGDALSLLQTIQNSRGQCAADEAAAQAAFQAAIATGRRAVEALRENWDYEEMAIALFNIAYAERELGDVEGALQSLQQVIAWDLEYGLYGELEGDYSALLRWRSGEEADPEAVRRFVEAYKQPRARFHFAWKPHRAMRKTETERVMLRRGALQETGSRSEFESSARRDGDDWVLSATARNAPRVESTGTGAGTDDLQELLGRLSTALPDVVIGADGSFKSLRNLDRFRDSAGRELDRLLERSTPAGKPAPDAQAVAAAKAALLNPDLLESNVSGQWNLEVGAWIGGEFDHGDWYEATFEEPLPGFSEKPLSMTWTFKIARWLPCDAGPEPRCVEVLLHIRPDPEQIRQAIAVFVGRMMPAADRQRVEQAMREVSYRLEWRYRLVTEPDTLRPWSFEERKYVYGASIENGKREVTARFDRRLETIRYLD
ncbi:MAG TPA: hypothetical protein VFR29_04265 [Steroidobacteraceae bacterium]|nr:hypothetical protein [Steroidobacteraceae bacterium]